MSSPPLPDPHPRAISHRYDSAKNPSPGSSYCGIALWRKVELYIFIMLSADAGNTDFPVPVIPWTDTNPQTQRTRVAWPTSFTAVSITDVPLAVPHRIQYSFPVRACELFAKTRNKERDLRALGMKVISIWEHEFDTLLATYIDARNFVDSLDLEERLDPRDSLTGGRTNGCVLYKRVPEKVKIKYVDFTS